VTEAIVKTPVPPPPATLRSRGLGVPFSPDRVAHHRGNQLEKQTALDILLGLLPFIHKYFHDGGVCGFSQCPFWLMSSQPGRCHSCPTVWVWGRYNDSGAVRPELRWQEHCGPEGPVPALYLRPQARLTTLIMP
jgi:hypothetical protein